MRDNYKKALQKAQMQTTIKPPKKYQSISEVKGVGEDIASRAAQKLINAATIDGNVGRTSTNQSAAIIEDVNNNGIPDYLEVSKTIPMVGASPASNKFIDPASNKGAYDINQGDFGKEIAKVNMAKVGGEGYMSALKAFKKGGNVK